MSKKYVFFAVLLGIVLGMWGFILYYFVNTRPAGILVESNPASTVYIDGREVGVTPYEAQFSKKEVILKLVANGEEFETKIKLSQGVKTIVRRNFTEDGQSGQIISFEKGGGAAISIISDPTSAQVSLDGRVRGFAPILMSKVTEGEHQLTLTADGFEESSFRVKALNGYKLVAVVKLAKLPEKTQTEEPKDEQMVEILQTPTGFLRVREKPISASNEVGRVNPGEKYKLISTDEQTKWYEIEIGEGEVGWISPQYATISN